jgi:hypothetical protein
MLRRKMVLLVGYLATRLWVTAVNIEYIRNNTRLPIHCKQAGAQGILTVPQVQNSVDLSVGKGTKGVM